MALTQTATLWLGTVALLVSYLGMVRASDRKTQTIMMGAALVVWAVFALAATNMTIYEGATVYQQGSQMLALLGVLGAGTSLIVLFETVFRSFTS